MAKCARRPDLIIVMTWSQQIGAGSAGSCSISRSCRSLAIDGPRYSSHPGGLSKSRFGRSHLECQISVVGKHEGEEFRSSAVDAFAAGEEPAGGRAGTGVDLEQCPVEEG